MVRNHCVLFSTAIIDGEASTIIRVQLDDGLVDDIEIICRGTIVVDGDSFVCPDICGTLWTDRRFGRFEICGSDSLLTLLHVVISGFHGI